MIRSLALLLALLCCAARAAQPVLFTSDVSLDPSAEALQGGGCAGEIFTVPAGATWTVVNASASLACGSSETPCTSVLLSAHIYTLQSNNQASPFGAQCGAPMVTLATLAQSATLVYFNFTGCTLTLGRYILAFDMEFGHGAVLLGYGTPGVPQPGDGGVASYFRSYCATATTFTTLLPTQGITGLVLYGTAVTVPTAPTEAPTEAPTVLPTAAPTGTPTRNGPAPTIFAGWSIPSAAATPGASLWAAVALLVVLLFLL